MAAVYVPINGAVLVWAREEAGASRAGLAERLGLDAETVAAWESGKQQPNKTQLGGLARALKRPPSFFLLPRPPEAGTPTPRFRAAIRESEHRSLTDAERDAIRLAVRLQRVAAWLARTNGRGVELPDGREISAPKAATLAATALGWSVERQTSSPDAASVGRDLRATVEEAGIQTLRFGLSASEPQLRGFALWDEYAPLIFVNSHQMPEPALFTLAHELGHLLRRDTRVTTGQPTDVTERWCERFAAAFLLPASELRTYVRDQLAAERVTSMNVVRAVAGHFRVSLRAATVRLIDVGLADHSLYGRVDRLAEFRPRPTKSRRAGGPPRPKKRLQEWGRLYAQRLDDAEQRGLLSRYDLLDYLNVSDNELDVLRNELRSA